MNAIKVFTPYQPELFVPNIDRSISQEYLFDFFEHSNLGKVKSVVIKRGKKYDYAIVTFHMWNLCDTIIDRKNLSNGKPIIMYHTNSKYWKVYAYDNERKEQKPTVSKKTHPETNTKTDITKNSKQENIVTEKSVEEFLSTILSPVTNTPAPKIVNIKINANAPKKIINKNNRIIKNEQEKVSKKLEFDDCDDKPIQLEQECVDRFDVDAPAVDSESQKINYGNAPLPKIRRIVPARVRANLRKLALQNQNK